MDDEEIVRGAASEMLEHIGYTVEFAKEGKEAVDMYGKAIEDGQPFDAVIMDLTVPGGMGGMDALSQLKSIDPEVRAVVSSGYSNDAVLSNYREYGFSAMVKKPYDLKELAEAITKMLSN